MKNLYWLGAVLVIVGGVYFSIQYGVRPKAVAVVKPSNFETGERVGEIIYRQLFPLMEKYRIVALGQNNIALATLRLRDRRLAHRGVSCLLRRLYPTCSQRFGQISGGNKRLYVEWPRKPKLRCAAWSSLWSVGNSRQLLTASIRCMTSHRRTRM